jgi:hypothetical protein
VSEEDAAFVFIVEMKVRKLMCYREVQARMLDQSEDWEERWN